MPPKFGNCDKIGAEVGVVKGILCGTLGIAYHINNSGRSSSPTTCLNV